MLDYSIFLWGFIAGQILTLLVVGMFGLCLYRMREVDHDAG